MKIEINKTDAYLQQVNDRYHQFAMRELKLYMMQKEDMDISIIENQKRLMKQSKKIVSEFNRKPTLEGCKQIYINAAEIEKAIERSKLELNCYDCKKTKDLNEGKGMPDLYCTAHEIRVEYENHKAENCIFYDEKENNLIRRSQEYVDKRIKCIDDFLEIKFRQIKEWNV
jgi:hypothetical protein